MGGGHVRREEEVGTQKSPSQQRWCPLPSLKSVSHHHQHQVFVEPPHDRPWTPDPNVRANWSASAAVMSVFVGEEEGKIGLLAAGVLWSKGAALGRTLLVL